MTEIIQHLPNGRKLRIQRDIVADPLTLFQIQTGKYPVCPIFKTDIFKMDYEELKQYSYWKSQNTIITNNKKFLALCRRANLMCSSGQIGQRGDQPLQSSAASFGIFACPGVDVLAQQGDFLCPGIDQALRLGEQIGEGP